MEKVMKYESYSQNEYSVKYVNAKQVSNVTKNIAVICLSSLQFSSVAQSCPTLCNPMDYSTPGFPVLHHLPEFAQTHVH